MGITFRAYRRYPFQCARLGLGCAHQPKCAIPSERSLFEAVVLDRADVIARNAEYSPEHFEAVAVIHFGFGAKSLWLLRQWLSQVGPGTVISEWRAIG